MQAKELRSFFNRACAALLPVDIQDRETTRPEPPQCVNSLEEYCAWLGVDPKEAVRR